MIEKVIRCDDCNKIGVHGPEPVAELKNLARRDGWIVSNDKAYCDECKETHEPKKRLDAMRLALDICRQYHEYWTNETEPYNRHLLGRRHDIYLLVEKFYKTLGTTARDVSRKNLMDIVKEASREVQSWPSWKRGEVRQRREAAEEANEARRRARDDE